MSAMSGSAPTSSRADAVEKSRVELRGVPPHRFLAFTSAPPSTSARQISGWLKADFDLGRGHAMALVYVIRNGDKIDPKHVGSDGVHRDPSDTLWLDGKATNPAAIG